MGRSDAIISPVAQPKPVVISITDPITGSPTWRSSPQTNPTSTGSKIIVDPSSTQVLPHQTKRTLTMPAQGTVKPWARGHVQTGGNIVMWKVSGGKYYFCYVVAGHEIHAYTKIMLGDYQLQLPTSIGVAGTGRFGAYGSYWTEAGGSRNYRLYLGTSAQTLDTTLHGLDARWIYAYNGTETNSLGLTVKQCAYFWIAQPIPIGTPVNNAPTPDPMRMTCEMDAGLCYDHRLDPTLATKYFTTNSALICADAKLQFQLRGDVSQIDWDSVDESADVCDQLLGDGSKRYEMSIVLRDAVPYPQLEDALRQHCMGAWVRNQGKWRFYIDRAQAWSGFSFSDGSDGAKANLRDGVELGVITKASDAIPTQVEVQYTDAADGFKQKSVFVGTDDRRKKTYQLVGLQNSKIALRVAIQIYNRGRLDKTVPLPMNEEGARILPGMVVKVTIANGLTAQPVLITDVKTVGGEASGHDGDTEWYDPAAYSDSIATQDTTSSDPLPDPNATPPPPSLCSAVEVPRTGTDGRLASTIELGWTIPTWPYYQKTRITLGLSDDGGVTYGPETDVKTLEGSSYTFPSPQIGRLHLFRFYGVAYPSGLQTDPADFNAMTNLGMASVTPVFNGGIAIPDVTGLVAESGPADADMGACYWDPLDPLVAGTKYVSVADAYTLHSGVWRLSQPNIDLKSFPTSANPLRLRAFVDGDPSVGFNFGVKIVLKDKVGNQSPGAQTSWFVPPSLAPLQKIFYADAFGKIHSVATTFSAARSGAGATQTATANQAEVATSQISTNYELYRTWARFPVSLPSSAIISAVYLGFIIIGGGNVDDNPFVNVYPGTETNDPPLTSDWTNFNSGQLLATAQLSAAPSGSKVVWWIPLSDISTIVNGEVRMALITSLDHGNTAPPATHQNNVFGSGPGNVFMLKVIYTDPSAGGGSGGGGGNVTPFRIVMDGLSNAITLPFSPSAIIGPHFDRTPMMPPDSSNANGDFTLAGNVLTIPDGTQFLGAGVSLPSSFAGHVISGGCIP